MTSIASIAQRILDEHGYLTTDFANFSLTKLEYTIDDAIDYVNLTAGLTIADLTGSAETKSIVATDGQKLTLGDTTITIHEWAGVYTYRLDATERWRLEASQIRQGDKVQFLACNAGETVRDFRKM